MAIIRSWLVAQFYDVVMRGTEQRCLGRWRTELLHGLSGDVLEIGSGTGINLAYYPARVSRLVLSESDPSMRKRLQRRVLQSGRDRVSIFASGAEAIGFPDQSFDYVVSTLVLCSVTSQQDSLREIRRLLRPGGKVVFIEHVAAADNPRLFRWQQLCEPLWGLMTCSCHLTRDTEAMIRNAGFDFLSIDRVLMPGVPAVVQPVIKGVARVL